MVDALARARGSMTPDALADAVYADDPNGGPENAAGTIAVIAHNAAAAGVLDDMERLGWRLVRPGGRGGVYRLEPA